MREPDFIVSGKIKHKLSCTATDDGLKFEISNLGSRGIQDNYGQEKPAVCGLQPPYLHLCFRICKSRFSHDVAHFSSTDRLRLYEPRREKTSILVSDLV